MDIDSLITWKAPVYPPHLSPEEYLRVKTAICQFSDSPATFEWFRSRGYTLFERNPMHSAKYASSPDSFYPRVPQAAPDPAPAHYPFPYRNGCSYDSKVMGVSGSFGKIWFAQDSQGRHVALNLVPEDSDEFRIYQLIREQTLETLRRVCLLPVLDVLSLGKHRFVVMPRWGSGVTIPPPQTLREATDLLYSMLRALDFLHSHNIVHRDIGWCNMLVNHYCDCRLFDGRNTVRREGLLCYAVIDFDTAVAFPPGAERSACKLPSYMSYEGRLPQPDDVAEGQPDYDPFAFDVGCMGLLFCGIIHEHIPDLPFLAPFLDKMMAKDVSRRFTVAEALDFFESHLKEACPADLAKPYIVCHPDHYCKYDRWSAIPAELAEKWSQYREPSSMRSFVDSDDEDDGAC